MSAILKRSAVLNEICFTVGGIPVANSKHEWSFMYPVHFSKFMYELVSPISNVSKYHVNTNNTSKEDDAIIDKLSPEDSLISDLGIISRRRVEIYNLFILQKEVVY